MDAPVIAVEHLTKDFAAVRALDDVSLAIAPAEVRGIIGENGAGKSTLMKILSGLYHPTAGRVLIRGLEARMHGPGDAQRLGIAMIHQELNLVDELTVADNIFLGRERTKAGLIARRRTLADAAKILGSFDCPVSPRARVRDLSIGQMQMVEIAKALAADASILIMDEPTAVLTRAETANLFTLIRRLKARGVSILYISHILTEVLTICDRITVLRDGRYVDTVSAGAGTSEGQLARLMVGRDLTEQYPPPGRDDRVDTTGPAALDILGLSVPGHADDVSFSVRRGEILGFAGLIGAGRTEVAEAIAGLRRHTHGTIVANGAGAAIATPRDATRHRIAYLSEDRRGRGLTMGMGIVENTTMVSLARYRRGPFINRAAEDIATLRHVSQMGIRTGGPKHLRAAIDTLSGGNQQKVAIAKWLETAPDVLILDEPTRGVDVGAKREIYLLIRQLADAGKACIFISSELGELLGMCDRILVMRNGRVSGVLPRAEFSEQRVMYLAAGVADSTALGGTAA